MSSGIGDEGQIVPVGNRVNAPDASTHANDSLPAMPWQDLAEIIACAVLLLLLLFCSHLPLYFLRLVQTYHGRAAQTQFFNHWSAVAFTCIGDIELVLAFTSATLLQRYFAREPGWSALSAMAAFVTIAAIVTGLASKLQSLGPWPKGTTSQYWDWLQAVWAILVAYVCNIPWDRAVKAAASGGFQARFKTLRLRLAHRLGRATAKEP